MVLDAMSEARGYGMALACLIWALELMLELAEQFSEAKFNLAAVLLRVERGCIAGLRGAGRGTGRGVPGVGARMDLAQGQGTGLRS